MNKNCPVVSARDSGIFPIIRTPRFPDFLKSKEAQ